MSLKTFKSQIEAPRDLIDLDDLRFESGKIKLTNKTKKKGDKPLYQVAQRGSLFFKTTLEGIEFEGNYIKKDVRIIVNPNKPDFYVPKMLIDLPISETGDSLKAYLLQAKEIQKTNIIRLEPNNEHWDFRKIDKLKDRLIRQFNGEFEFEWKMNKYPFYTDPLFGQVLVEPDIK